MAVAINASASFEFEIPRALFSIRSPGLSGRAYAVTKDGKKFLVAVPQSASAAAPLTVLLNWSAAVPK